jgi:hypothetical protein
MMSGMATFAEAGVSETKGAGGDGG